MMMHVKELLEILSFADKEAPVYIVSEFGDFEFADSSNFSVSGLNELFIKSHEIDGPSKDDLEEEIDSLQNDLYYKDEEIARLESEIDEKKDLIENYSGMLDDYARSLRGFVPDEIVDDLLDFSDSLHQGEECFTGNTYYHGKKGERLCG